jgi:hypothetical protein
MAVLGKPDEVHEVVHSIRMESDEGSATLAGESRPEPKGGWMKSGLAS